MGFAALSVHHHHQGTKTARAAALSPWSRVSCLSFGWSLISPGHGLNPFPRIHPRGSRRAHIQQLPWSTPTLHSGAICCQQLGDMPREPVHCSAHLPAFTCGASRSRHWPCSPDLSHSSLEASYPSDGWHTLGLLPRLYS